MKFRNILTLLTASFALLAGFVPASNGFLDAHAEEPAAPAIISSQKEITVQSNSSAYVPIIANNLTCAGLELEIYYDIKYFSKVSSIYSDQSFDASQQEFFTYDCSQEGLIKATYLFKKNRTFTSDNLFYFYLYSKDISYNVSSFLDIVIGNAIDENGNSINIEGKRSYINIIKNDNVEHKYVNHYVNLNKTEIYKEDILTFNLNTSYGYEYKSGELNIEYDRDLLEFQSITYKSQLENALVDVNSSVKGVVFISFISNELVRTYSDLLEINFKVLKSINTETYIRTNFKVIADQYGAKMRADNLENAVNILETPVVPVTPKLYLDNVNVESLHNFDINLYIDKDSNLGAGDFKLYFDVNKVKYVSHQLEKNPSIMLGVNNKKATSGEIGISILSTKGIVDALKLVKFTFVSVIDLDETLQFNLTGKNITDRLANPIELDVQGSNVTFTPHIHRYGNWKVVKNPTCKEEGLQERTCELCGHVEQRSIAKVDHSISTWEVVKKPTYIHPGIKQGKCDVCGQLIQVEIPRLLSDSEYQEMLTYCQNFLASNICGTNDFTKADSALFLKQKEAYELLSENVKIALKETIANSYDNNPIEMALAKYDRIIQLYNKNQPDLFPNFMNRANGIDPQENPFNNNKDISQYNGVIAVFIIVSSLSIICACIIYDKRKHLEK